MKRVLLVLGVVAALAGGLALLGPGLSPRAGTLTTEPQRYLGMAGWQPSFRLADQNFVTRYRILTPAIVHALPLSPPLAFHLLTLTNLTLFAFLIRGLSRRLGVRGGNWSLLLAITVYYPTVYYLKTPFMTDPLFLVLWTAGLWLAAQDRDALVALVVAVGVLNKETIVFLFPSLVALWFEADRPLRAARRAVLAIAPALAIYVALRWSFGHSTSQMIITPDAIGQWARENLAGDLYRRFLSGFLLAAGPCWLYILALRPDDPPPLRRSFIGGVFAVFPLFALAWDTGRQMANFAPFWIPVVLRVLEDRKLGGAPAVVFVAAGNVLIAVATLVTLPSAGEAGLRLLGIALSLMPLLMGRPRVQVS